MMWRLLSRLASPGAQRGSLSVLFFHRVFARSDPLMPGEPTADSFDALLGWLQSQFNVLPLDEAVSRLAAGSLPPAAAAISFDDGYRDNVEVAAPLLQRRGLPATFFIASGFLDGGLMWNDGVAEAIRASTCTSLRIPGLPLPAMPLDSWTARSAALGAVLQAIKYLPVAERDQHVAAVQRACGTAAPRDLMMSSAQVRALVAMGFGIGAHTVTHPILTRLPDAQAEVEITLGRDQLQALTDRRVGLFAYPNGRAGIDFDARHCQMARAAGFDAAFTTEPGVCRRSTSPWLLSRFTPWDRRSEHRFRRQLLHNQWRRPLPLGIDAA